MENLRNALHHILLKGRFSSASSNTNMKTYRADLKELKLEVLLFCHFMYEDDDRLSLFEKNQIIKMAKEEREIIPEAVEKQFIEWMDNPPSLGYILDYARDNGYTYEDLDDAIRAFVQQTDSNSKYHPVIRSVRKKLILEKDYLRK